MNIMESYWLSVPIDGNDLSGNFLYLLTIVISKTES